MPALTVPIDVDFLDAMMGMYAVKQGARHSKADQEMLQAIHDTSGTMGAKHKKKMDVNGGDGGNGEAKHMDGDLVTHLQGIHDQSVGLGALCDYADDMPSAEQRGDPGGSAEQKFAPNYHIAAKSMQDASNLRAKWAHRCENCVNYQSLVEGVWKCHDGDWGESENGDEHSGYACVKFDFQPDPMWVCDDWETVPPPTAQGDQPMPVVIVEPEDFEDGTDTGDEGKAWAEFSADLIAEFKIAAREDVSSADKKKRAGEASNFADPKNKRYKLDTEKQIRAAWSYIGMPKNQSKYSAKDVASIKKKIVSAWKKKIDKEGPPAAKAIGYMNPDDVKLDTEKEIRAAWAHVNHPSSEDKYSAADKKALEAKIVAAWKKVIDPAGPDSAAEGKSSDLYAVKFLDERQDRIKGYAVLWGDEEHPDLSHQKDFFTKSTDFVEVKFPTRALAYHHGFDESTKDAPFIGVVTDIGNDEVGRWYKAQLDKAHKYYAAVKQLIQQGALKTSSDSIPQYVRRQPRRNGTNEVKCWPMPCVSLTPTPAEPRMWKVEELKAAYKSIGIDFVMPEATEAGASRVAASEAKSGGNGNHDSSNLGVTPMEEKELRAFYDKVRAEEKERERILAEAKTKFDADVKAEVDKQVQEKLKIAAKSGRPPIFHDGKPEDQVQVLSKYDQVPGNTADEQLMNLAILAIARNEAKSIGHSVGADEELLRAIATRAFKGVEKGQIEAKALEDLVDKDGYALKSNEIMGTALANYGQDWAVTLYSTQLWQKIRNKARLFSTGFIPEQELPKGFKSDTIQLESTDVIFYNVAQAIDEDGTMKIPAATITSSKAGSATREITIFKIGARSGISGELDEDGIIDSMPEVRRKLEAELGPEMDFVLFNMDTTAATNNINGNGTPTSGADYTVAKGLARLALKDGAITPLDASHALTSGKIRTQYAAFVNADLDSVIADDPARVRVFCDSAYTWWALEGLSDLLTVSNAGQDWATIVRGADPDKGLPVHQVLWHPSAGVKPAQATGVRHSATKAPDGSDIYGRAIMVAGDQWKIRWKRRAKFETKRIPEADMDYLIMTLRMGLGYFDTYASTMIYDI